MSDDLVQRLRDAVNDVMRHQFTNSRSGMAALQDLIDEAEDAADRIEALELELGKTRLCLTCGKTRDATVPKEQPGCPETEIGHVCQFDLTPGEAWQYWRVKAHEQRDRIDADRKAMQQALEVLEMVDEAMPFPSGSRAIAALRERLK